MDALDDTSGAARLSDVGRTVLETVDVRTIRGEPKRSRFPSHLLANEALPPTHVSDESLAETFGRQDLAGDWEFAH